MLDNDIEKNTTLGKPVDINFPKGRDNNFLEDRDNERNKEPLFRFLEYILLNNYREKNLQDFANRNLKKNHGKISLSRERVWMR